MFRYVSERGEAHERQLCPPDAPGAGADTSHCDEAGKYSAVRGFAHAVCKSELEDCTDDDRPDPAVADAAHRRTAPQSLKRTASLERRRVY